MLFSAGCVGGLADFDFRSNAPVNSAEFKAFCADRDITTRFENRIIATTSSVEEKYAAFNILVGPATVPFAGVEGLYVGGKNIYDSIVNSEQSQAADKRCEGVE